MASKALPAGQNARDGQLPITRLRKPRGYPVPGQKSVVWHFSHLLGQIVITPGIVGRRSRLLRSLHYPSGCRFLEGSLHIPPSSHATGTRMGGSEQYRPREQEEGKTRG